MGVRFDRLRYEVFQNLILSPMNTGSLRPAVATTPTACGIETVNLSATRISLNKLQQHLPLAVLKHKPLHFPWLRKLVVATTPTACGIETVNVASKTFCYAKLQQHLPLAVLKLCKIEIRFSVVAFVATTPTACGIETDHI